jgi:hypothetical protein
VISALSAASVFGLTPGVHPKASTTPHATLTPTLTHPARPAKSPSPPTQAQDRSKHTPHLTSSLPVRRPTHTTSHTGAVPPVGTSQGVSTLTTLTTRPPTAVHEPTETGKPPTPEPAGPTSPRNPPTAPRLPELPRVPSPPPVTVPAVLTITLTVTSVP